MNTLKDELNNIALRAIEIRDEAYSAIKDPDDAEVMFEDLLEALVADVHYDIKAGLNRFLEE